MENTFCVIYQLSDCTWGVTNCLVERGRIWKTDRQRFRAELSNSPPGFDIHSFRPHFLQNECAKTLTRRDLTHSDEVNDASHHGPRGSCHVLKGASDRTAAHSLC